MTGMRCASDQRSAGSKRVWISRMTRFSCSGILPPRNSATAAGTNVSDSSIALVSASTTVMAIGWNIFPSMPVSAKMGRYTAVMMPMPNRLGRMTSAVRSRRKLETLIAMKNAAEARLLLTESPQRVLDDDHGAVDDEAEVERAEAHEIPGHATAHHPGDRHEHG